VFSDTFNTSEGLITLNNSTVVLENNFVPGVCRITTFTFVTSEALSLRMPTALKNFKEKLQAFFKLSKTVAEFVIKVVPYFLTALAAVHKATILP